VLRIIPVPLQQGLEAGMVAEGKPRIQARGNLEKDREEEFTCKPTKVDP